MFRNRVGDDDAASGGDRKNDDKNDDDSDDELLNGDARDDISDIGEFMNQ